MNERLLERLDAVMTLGQSVINGSWSDYSWSSEFEVLSEFRSSGLILLEELYGIEDHRYIDFDASAGKHVVLETRKALGVLNAVREDAKSHPLTMVRPVEIDAGQARDARSVAVVHGRNESARQAMFTFLGAVGLEPLEWSHAMKQTGSASPFIGEVLDALFENAQAVVVLLTGDDEAWLRPEFRKDDDPLHEQQPTPQGRPNVLFEAGMAFGRHPKRTILVELGHTRPFSDVAGRFVVKLANDIASRQRLVSALDRAGCPVSNTLHTTDWHEAGDFDAAIPPAVRSEQASATGVKSDQWIRSIELLLAEISENMKMGGRAASQLEHRHLDTVIHLAEHQELDKKDPPLMFALRTLKQRTNAQLAMLGYGSAAGSMMTTNYRPVAEELANMLRELLLRFPSS